MVAPYSISRWNFLLALLLLFFVGDTCPISMPTYAQRSVMNSDNTSAAFTEFVGHFISITLYRCTHWLSVHLSIPGETSGTNDNASTPGLPELYDNVYFDSDSDEEETAPSKCVARINL
jgi:hypothetical protein